MIFEIIGCAIYPCFRSPILENVSRNSRQELFHLELEVCGLSASASGLAHISSPSGCKGATLTVSVAICTKNRPANLRECLSAVARLDPMPDEILVVDNTQGNEETASLSREFGARYVVEPVPGLSRARNRGLAECDTEIVAFLDDDAIPAPDWLGILVGPFADSQTAASTGRVINPGSRRVDAPPECFRTLSNKDRHWFEIATFGGMPSAIVFHPIHRRDPVEIEARNSFAYWLLLFSAFPTERLSLLSFISRRLRRRPLDWPRDPQEPGEIVTSSYRLLFKAGWQGLWLFLRTPRNWNSSK